MYKQKMTSLDNFLLAIRRIRFLGRAALIAALGIVFATGSGSVSIAEETCAELLTNRCETCHYNTRVCQKLKKKKGKGSWKRTIKNMVKQGAKLDKAEQKQLVTCLSKRTPDVLKLCNMQK